MRYLKFILLVFVVFCFRDFYAQVVIKELPKPAGSVYDSSLAGISSKRNIILLNGRWNAFVGDDRDNQVQVTVPSTFKGVDELVFEKSFTLTEDQINNYKLQLFFDGISHSAEVVVNNYVIYKHPGGEFPFRVNLPKDILASKKRNILSVRVNHVLHSEVTIPSKTRFLFPELSGGIFRDVYIRLLPLVNISSLDLTNNVFNYSARINLNLKFENNSGDGKPDTINSGSEYNYRILLNSPSGAQVISYTSPVFRLNSRKEKSLSQTVEVQNPDLWYPNIPRSYRLSVQLVKGEQVVDEIVKPVAFYFLEADKDSLLLNGKSFIMHGTTYYPSFQNYGNLGNKNDMERDIKIIKSMGFNAVRFAKDVPHPYYLELCRQYGLLAFIELPINSLPQKISTKESFNERVKSYFLQYLSYYKNFSSVAAIGLGSSYLSGSEEQAAFLQYLGDIVKKNTNKPVYASFVGFDIQPIKNIDFYGVELYYKPIEDYSNQYINIEKRLGKGRVFISEATYPTYLGGTNGYLNPYSLEAQAKYFGDLIDFVLEDQSSGYFINSAFDYRGDYVSLTTGYTENNLYKVGILGEDRENNRLTQKVIYSKLNDGERVTIPIGSRSEDIPLIFIITGVGLALIMGFLINSRRKFREDATRALLRPYNFFADVRDHRLFSVYQASLLMVILSICSALLQINILYFFRTNLLVEKVLLAFGSPCILKLVSYLAWNPNEALIWLTSASIVFFIVFSILVKIASFFVRNKVFFSSIFYSVVWAFLPLILLLPLGLILYKVLNADVINLYLMAALAVFTIWIYYRLMKGIYVIFDVNPGRVYFYSLALILLSVGGILLYFQLSESTIYYIVNAFNQYKQM